MKKKIITVDISGKDLKKKLDIKDGYTPIKGVDYFDGKDAVVDTEKLAIEASQIAVERIKPSIPTIEQVEQDIPKLGESIRDSLELLQGSERLDKKAILGLEDYEEISKLAREPKVNKIYQGGGGARQFTALTDAPSSYTSQALKAVRVKSDETGLEFYTPPTPSTPSLQEVTDVGATTTVESTFSSGIITGNVKANSSAGTSFKTNSNAEWLHGGNGGGANATMYGGWNYDNGTANTLLSLGASKTLQSASVGSTLSFSANTLGINLANQNTWSAQQIFNKDDINTPISPPSNLAISFTLDGSGFYATGVNYSFVIYAYLGGVYDIVGTANNATDPNDNDYYYIDLTWDATTADGYFVYDVNNNQYYDVGNTTYFQVTPYISWTGGTPPDSPSYVSTPQNALTAQSDKDWYNQDINVFEFGNDSGGSSSSLPLRFYWSNPTTGSGYLRFDDSIGNIQTINANISANSITLGGSALSTLFQGKDVDLTALANNSTNGLWARTGSGTGSARTIVAGNSSLTVTNGNGVSGNPSLVLNVSNANTWTGQQTFNTSAPIIGTATASTIAGFDSSKQLITLATSTYPSLIELSYVKGVTSSIQTQLNSKLSSVSLTSTQIGFGNGSNVMTSSSKLTFTDSTGKMRISGVQSPTIELYTSLAGSSDRNWSITTTQGVNGNFVINKSTSAGGDPANNPVFGLDQYGSLQVGTNSSFTYPSPLPVESKTINIKSSSSSYGTGILARRGGDEATGFNIWEYGGNFYIDSYYNDDGSNFYLRVKAAGTPVTAMTIKGTADIGIGNTSPSAKLHIVKTTEQLRVGYDTSNYFKTTVGSSGGVTFDAVGSGASFTFSDPVIFDSTARLKGYTVATLPTGTEGDIAYVTDALAPTFLATVVGGGAIKTPVFFDGTNWVAY